MKRLMMYITALLLTLTLLTPCVVALADMEAAAEQTSVEEGQTVTVTLNITGEKLSVAEGTFTYDPSVLAFDEGVGGVTDGVFALYSAEKGGSSALSATLTFKALKAGEAKIAFELTNLINYSGKALDNASAEVSFTITARPPSTPEPPVDYSDPSVGIKAQNVTGATADMYIWRSIDNVTIPSRYTETELEYKGEKAIGAAVKDSDAPVLFYLSDAAGDNARYYIYDAGRDMFYEYHTVSTVSRSYIILEPDGAVPVPEGFSETTLTIDDNELKAWGREDAQGTLYLLYARSPGGDIGFYLYSPEDEALQSFAVTPARPEVTIPEQTPAVTEPAQAPAETPAPAENTDDAGNITLSKGLFIAICVFAGLLLATLVGMTLANAAEKAKRIKRAAARRERDKAAMDALNAKGEHKEQ